MSSTAHDHGGHPARPGPALLAACCLVGGLLLWIYVPHLASMAKNWWTDPNYSHGFMVPLVSAWLVWRERESLLALPQGPCAWGLLVLAAGLLVLLVGQLAQEFFLRRISLLPVLWGLLLTYWGWAWARRLLFPVAYLVLMVPLPYVVYDSVAFPLRLLAASLAGWGLRLLGYPVLVEGNVIHLPSVVMDVVDACSGIRSLISLLAVGVILAHLMLASRWRQVLLVALVPPVAMLANALRVLITGVLAERLGEAVIKGATHDFVGWLVFMAGFVILLGITSLLRGPEPGGGAGHGK
ncbi:MAG: exosortase/archaeosortase family protein [Desulfarculus sp.]|nr:exosortase/archaeosortase family protein [Desulfarculus sp.]